MNKSNKSAPVLVSSDSLIKLENDICNISYLLEFIVCSLTRSLEIQEDELSFSYGEARALINLMEKVHQDIENTIVALVDRKGGGAS